MRVHMFTVTAALFGLVLAANTWPAVESSLGDDIKREVFTKLCKVECIKLKCASSEPLPDTNECTCLACDMETVGEDDGKAQGQRISTLRHFRLQFYMKGVNTTTNSKHTLTREQSSSKEEGTETLSTWLRVEYINETDILFTEKTCAMECSRLDCESYTFDVKENKCLCESCDLEVVGDSKEGQIAEMKRSKRDTHSCHYRSKLQYRQKKSITYTGSWFRGRTHYYHKRVAYYRSELCCYHIIGVSHCIGV